MLNFAAVHKPLVRVGRALALHCGYLANRDSGFARALAELIVSFALVTGAVGLAAAMTLTDEAIALRSVKINLEASFG